MKPRQISGFSLPITTCTSCTGGFGDTGLGFFGKGAMLPPPPAGQTVTKKIIPTAKNKKTGKFYEQDSRCAVTGEKMTKFDEPCTEADCDPGERDIYEECALDPDYEALTPPPAQGFRDCKQWEQYGYPAQDCNRQTCPSCFHKRPSTGPQPQQQASSKPAPPPPLTPARTWRRCAPTILAWPRPRSSLPVWKRRWPALI